MSKQKYRIQYELPNGKLCVDKSIWAENEHQATNIATNNLEELTYDTNLNFIMGVRDAKLIITKE